MKNKIYPPVNGVVPNKHSFIRRDSLSLSLSVSLSCASASGVSNSILQIPVGNEGVGDGLALLFVQKVVMLRV